MSTRNERSPRAGLVWLALTALSIALWAGIIYGVVTLALGA